MILAALYALQILAHQVRNTCPYCDTGKDYVYPVFHEHTYHTVVTTNYLPVVDIDDPNPANPKAPPRNEEAKAKPLTEYPSLLNPEACVIVCENGDIQVVSGGKTNTVATYGITLKPSSGAKETK